MHGKVEIWKRWKRIVSCNGREKLIDTDSIKNKTITLKSTEYASGPLSQNTKNQQIIKNDIIQNKISNNAIESVECGHQDTATHLIAHSGEECKDGDRKLVGLQSTSEITDKTMAEYDRNQAVYTEKTLIVDDKNVDTGQEGSTVILTGINAAVTGDRGTINDVVLDENVKLKTINDVVLDETVKLNTNGIDVSNNVEVTYSNVGKKFEIVENTTVAGTQERMATATKRTGFYGLFRSPVLRKYNLIMVFVW